MVLCLSVLVNGYPGNNAQVCINITFWLTFICLAIAFCCILLNYQMHVKTSFLLELVLLLVVNYYGKKVFVFLSGIHVPPPSRFPNDTESRNKRRSSKKWVLYAWFLKTKQLIFTMFIPLWRYGVNCIANINRNVYIRIDLTKLINEQTCKVEISSLFGSLVKMWRLTLCVKRCLSKWSGNAVFIWKICYVLVYCVYLSLAFKVALSFPIN